MAEHMKPVQKGSEKNLLKAFSRLLPAVLLLLETMVAGSATASVQEWTSHGPEGGDVGSIVIDPTAPGVVYALSTLSVAGPFKSIDGGATWRRLNLARGHIVQALVIHPKNPSILYAATFQAGVFKSLDRGETWMSVGGLTDQLVSLAIDPVTPSILYAGTLFGAVFKSTDSGASWQATGAAFGDAQVSPIVIDPQTPSTLYAGAGGVFKSTDSGRTWLSLSNGPDVGTSAQSLVLDPVHPRTLYAVDSSQGVFKSTNGGARWTLVLATKTVKALAVDPHSPATLYAGTLSTGVLRSPDGGLSWGAAGLGGENIASLAIDPAAPATLYAGAYGSGVFKSTDNARIWRAVNKGLVGTVVKALAIDPTTPSVAYAGTLAGVGYKTTDGGLTWSTPNIGERGRGIWAFAVDPANPKTVYASTADGVLKSTDGGRRWDLSSSGLPESAFGLAIDPVTPSTLYAGMSGDAGVYKSVNGGQSWAPANTGLGRIRVWSLAIDPLSPAILYAATAGSGVYKSTNAGQTWFPANAGLSTSPQGIEAIAIDPTNPSTLFACDAGSGLARSTDAGAHWTIPLVNGLPLFCSSLAIAATSPATIYAGSMGSGVLRSENGGETWSLLNNGLTSLLVYALAADSTGAAVYAGTIGDGVFEYSTAPPTPCVASDTAACLHGGRFGVRATFATPEGQVGTAHVVRFTDDSAYLWFFNPDNIEAFLKVIDGCSVNDRFWVFDAGLTNVRTSVFVTDSQTGIVHSSINPQGTPFQPTQDTGTFPCGTAAAESWEPLEVGRGPGRAASEAAGTESTTHLWLGNFRFVVTTTFRTAAGQTGPGMAVPLTGDAGYFWFFDAANPEVLIKVLDACSPFRRFWIFAGGLTDLHVTTTVFDTVSLRSRTYVNPQGTAFTPVQDTDFPACDEP